MSKFKKGVFVVAFWSGFLWSSGGYGAIAPTVRASLKKMLAPVASEEGTVSALYAKTLKDPGSLSRPAVEKLLKFYKVPQAQFRQAVEKGESFERGEIEDEKVMSSALSFLQLALLKIRLESLENQGAPAFASIQDEMNLWFQFAAELPYNEGTLIGLKFAGVIRSLLLDELEAFVEKQKTALSRDSKWLHWTLHIRAPWPVDRMILTEARRVLHPASLAVAEKAAMKIQKNPYLSFEKAIGQIPGGKPHELEPLKNLWRDEDMGQMRAEINRLQGLRLKLAVAVFVARKGHDPVKIEELVSEKILSSVPVDYLTGKPFLLPTSPAQGKALPQGGKSEPGS